MLVRCMRSSVVAARFFSSSSIAGSLVSLSVAREVAKRPTSDVAIRETTKSVLPKIRPSVYFGRYLFRTPDIRSLNFKAAIKKQKRWGLEVSRDHINKVLRGLINKKRYNKALMLCQAIEAQKVFKLGECDYATQMRLIFKAHGLESAERFFEGLPKIMKTQITYTALLHIYVWKEKGIKAEALMRKMQENRLCTTAHCYIYMMQFYFSQGQFDRAEEMFVMARKRIAFALRVTGAPNYGVYSMWLSACARQNHVEAAETVVAEMRAARLSLNWRDIAKLAALYISTNQFEKAGRALKEIENMGVHTIPFPYYGLITLHARMGNKEEVFRIWGNMKCIMRGKNNYGYAVMVKSLLNLDLYDDAREVMMEWESNFIRYGKPFIYFHMMDRMRKYRRDHPRRLNIPSRNRLKVLGIRG